MSERYRRIVTSPHSAAEIEAIQFIGGNFDHIEEFVGGDAEWRNGALVVATLEGPLRVSDGDWIIKRSKGRFSTRDPESFEATFAPTTPQEGQ